MHYNICRLRYQYSPFPLRVPGMGNAHLINYIEPFITLNSASAEILKIMTNCVYQR